MLQRLRQPEGTLGTLSLVSALLLALVGAAGTIALVVSLATDSTFWSDTSGNKVAGIVFFLVTLAGAAGFVVMDRNVWGGAALAVLGGLAFAVVMFWTILTLLIGLGIVAVAVLRAREMHSHPHPTAAHA